MMIFWAQDFLRQKSSETKTWISFLGYGVSPRVWAMNMIGRCNIWVIWTEHIMSIWTEWDWDFEYDSIRSVCLHETSCIPINCIYSAHLLSKLLELGVGIQNPQNDQPIQFWDLYGVIKMLRWGLSSEDVNNVILTVQVLDDERLYFDSDPVNGCLVKSCAFLF